MATNITILDDNGVQTLAEEIFKIIKKDYASSEDLTTAISNLEAKIDSTDVLLSLNPKIDVNGNLTIDYPEGESAPSLAINEAGYLVLTDNGTETDAKIAKLKFSINDNGYLIATA